MTVCSTFLTPLIVLVRTLIRVIQEVLRTVCGWVSSVIRTVKTIVERICTWLPWPLSDLCNLVTRVIEVFETVWDWVCRNVIERIVSWIEAIVEYIVYVLRWVCWVISWPVRGVNLLLCRLGYRPTRFVHVCIRVLTDTEGVPAVSWDKVAQDVRQAAAILSRCNINLVVSGRETIEKREFLDGTTCDGSGMFSSFFTWFANNECVGCAGVTVYYVRTIPGAIGCAYPGSNWVTVAAGGDGRTMVQEIGHLCDLWGHSSDPNNVMTDQGGGTSDQITAGQCCMMRTSRFSSVTACGEPEVPGNPDDVRLLSSDRGSLLHSHGFQVARHKTTESQPMLTSRVVEAGIALLLLAAAARVSYPRLARRRLVAERDNSSRGLVRTLRSQHDR